ncbi:hypothetical protein ABT127_21215 [Streptomyces sp. NPDC001904]|uniref:hypothetical protein n=1 Tax=Streptomyces sp. NPDC001904 TaxID=3154531 RepID=UPI003330B670
MARSGPDGPLNDVGGHEDSCVVTTCGRRIAVRRIRLAPAGRPIGRVTLDVGADRGGEPGVWASLTSTEARELAQMLLLHAELTDSGADPHSRHG